MRKALWSTAALVALLSGTGVSPLQAADATPVAMGSADEPLKFLPPEVTVAAGGKVQWHNDAELQHDVHFEDSSLKGSDGLLSKGDKFELTFPKAGDYKYFCAPHKDAGMTGVVHVTAPGAPAASSTTTTASSTTTTAAGGQSTTTTTVPGAGAGAGSTTTTTAAGTATTVTTAPSATTPTSAPEGAGSSTAPAASGADETAAGDHGSEKPDAEKEEDDDSSPIGIAFAGVSTLLLMAITGKLLSSKS